MQSLSPPGMQPCCTTLAALLSIAGFWQHTWPTVMETTSKVHNKYVQLIWGHTGAGLKYPSISMPVMQSDDGTIEGSITQKVQKPLQ